MHPSPSHSRSVVPAVLRSIVCAAALAACLDEPPAYEASERPRIVVLWEPAACGAPHRIALELADEAGVPTSSSAPCAQGTLSVQVLHLGVYTGRVYAWTAGQPIRSIMPAWIDVDESIVRWRVETPE
ncbi:MAG TPA: hypothetical protein VNO30_36750 [Kofleriaceae bacterium]|nr:hypothetical protein [Kofleriaceae bacterium]